MSQAAVTAARTTTVYMDLAPGDRLVIGEGVELLFGGKVDIDMMSKSGRAARMRITAPQDVKIERMEVVDSRSKHEMIRTTERG